MIHADITIKGVVQGVGFRYYTVQSARTYGVKGFVKNQPNGDVYCEVEGEQKVLKLFIKQLNIGPALSRVTSINVNEMKDLQNFQTFEVRY